MRRIWETAGRWILARLTSRQTRAGGLGLIVGALALSWCFQWAAYFGTSLPAISALGLAMVLGLELGWRSLKPSASPAFVVRAAWGWPAFLTSWTIAFPWLIAGASQTLGAFSVTQFANPGQALAILFGQALMLITPAVYAAARLPFYCLSRPREERHEAVSAAGPFVGGLGLGILVLVFLLAPVLGLYATAVGLAVVGLLLGSIDGVARPEALRRAWRMGSMPFADSGRATQDTGSASADPGVVSKKDTGKAATQDTASTFGERFGRDLWTALVLVCLGGLFAWASRATDQLMAVTVSLLCTQWASLLIGWAMGLAWGNRRPQRDRDALNKSVLACLFVGGWMAALLAAFPFLIELFLGLTATVSNVLWLTLARLGLTGLMLLPLGVGWGALSALAHRRARFPGKPDAIPLLAAAFLAGWLLGRWVLLPQVPMEFSLPALALALGALAVVRMMSERQLPVGWVNRSALAGLGVLILAAPIWRENYRPDTAARLLFAAPVFAAYQAELDRELLSVLDEGRELVTREGQRGTYTLWQYRGSQFQLRESGLPKGQISGDVRTCPEYSAEVMPALLPLVLHERPDNVLILGLGSGVPVTTALAFPVLQVTCAEADPVLTKLLQEHVWSQATHDPSDDQRLTLLSVDPALYVRADGKGNGKTFDVIVSIPDQAALAHATPYFTRAFYEDAASKLTDEGTFCQRFAFVDFGPEALRTAAQTMRAVFSDVVFLEMAGGEMLLLGTNSPRGIVRNGLMERLQRGHVRRVLAQLGWDWSVPLNLSAFDHESLKKFSETETNTAWPAEPNTAANGTLAFRLPAEVARWGAKAQENQRALAGLGARLGEWGDIDPQDPDLLRRLAEVTGQRRLMISHPDEFWVYRKAVKDQVTKRRRAIIVQVKGEHPRQEIHPIDQRRLAYFRSLGATLKSHPHRLEDIARVEVFADPFDPLITYFLHEEAAELHSRAEPRDYAAELAHRLHAVYFAAPGDRSVRNLAAALELLSDHPEAAPDALARWDHLSALVQMMKLRWAIRAGQRPTSTQVMLNDVDKSLLAVNRALKTMETIAPEAGLPAEEQHARRRFLEKTIVHPLKDYRRQLLPFHLQQQRQRSKPDPSAEDADSSEPGPSTP